MGRWPVTLALLAALLAAAYGVCAAAAPGDPASKLDRRTRAALSQLRARRATVPQLRVQGAAVTAQGELDVFIVGDVSRGTLEAAGARVRTSLPGLCTAFVPEGAIDRVAALPGVRHVRAAVPVEPELQASVPTTGANLARGLGPDFAGINGQGVLIGFVDSGCDFDHADFKNPDGTTRLVSLWDQTQAGSGVPGHAYGTAWSRAQIDAGLCTEVDVDGHGTHVTGIAAGDGSQTGNGQPAFTYVGMAPKADIVMVKTDYNTTSIVDGIDYVFDLATARGQNAVVNVSLGTQYGSHDGLSPFESAISALTGPGRLVVKSAGNDRGLPRHAEVFATPGGVSATLSVTGASIVDRYFEVDGYYNVTERLRARITTPNGTVIGPLSLNSENAPYPGQVTPNGVVYLAHDSISVERRNVSLVVNIDAVGQNVAGTWTITFLADQLGAANGEVDLWRSAAVPGLTASFVIGNQPYEEMVTEPGNAFDVITVGSYSTRENWIACNGLTATFNSPPFGNFSLFSSPGPTRDGRQKPDLVAPGETILSTLTFDYESTCPEPPGTSALAQDLQHTAMRGTSMAAPHVTGAIALLLQKYGALTPASVRSYLTSHTLVDGFTGAVWNRDWGYGKLRVGDLVDPSVAVSSPNGGEDLVVNQVANLTWSATDLGGVSGVDLELSRSGSGGPFEALATGVANTGSYSWTVTGPPTQTGRCYLRATAHDANGNAASDLSNAGFTIHSPADVVPGTETEFALGSVNPNPARGSMRVEFTLPRGADVRVSVTDLQGRTVAVLAQGAKPPGRHTAAWNGTHGTRAAGAGLYFVVYDTPSGRMVRRFALAR